MNRVCALLLLFATCSGHASFPIQMRLVCPVGGQEFEHWGGGVGAVLDRSLDGKFAGASLQKLPICPENGFVIFTDKLTPHQVAALSQYLESLEYKELRSRHDNVHFLAAKLMQRINWPNAKIAKSFLQASWEERNEEDRILFRKLALDHYKASFRTRGPKSDEYLEDQMIAGELERRLQLFSDARSRFLRLRSQSIEKSTDTRKIIEYQLNLVASKDSSAHLRSSAVATR